MNTKQLLSSRLLTVLLVGSIAALSIHWINQVLDEARLDMTQDDLYSLAPGTKKILERIREEGVKPLEITLYFSETAGKTLPKFIKDFIGYQRYLRSLLGEYQRASQGKIRVAFIDPVPDTDEYQHAADAGLDGKLINQEGDLFYFGMTFETQTGSKEVIDFLWPNEQENIEYEISKTLQKLVWPKHKRVGVLSSLEVFGSAQDPYLAQIMQAQGRQPTPKWISMQLLEELYEVSQVPEDAEEISSEDYDLLLVIHPKNLSRKTLFALDQWIARGGHTMVFLDAYALDDRPPQDPQQPWMALQYKPSSNLPELLEAWGIERPEDAFAADFELAVRRPLGAGGPAEALIVDLSIDEERRAETLDTSSPALQGLSNLRFLLAGALRPVGGPAAATGEASTGEASSGAAATGDAAAGGDQGKARAVELVPLIQTTKAGSTLVVQPGFGGADTLAFTDFNDPAKLRDQFVPGSEPVVLAYLLRGKLGTAFPQGVDYPSVEPERPPGLPPGIELPPPADAEMIHKDSLPPEQYGDAAVIVFADVDFISDAIAFLQNPFGILQAANDNHRVLLNSVDVLLGSEELMSVRSKRPLSRPFKLFDQIEAEAEKVTLDRERQIRADIERFEEELRDKQGGITARNAALFQKKVQDEVDDLNQRIKDANHELADIRKDRRARLEREEAKVRFAMLGWMPLLVLGIGLFRAYKLRFGGDPFAPVGGRPAPAQTPQPPAEPTETAATTES